MLSCAVMATARARVLRIGIRLALLVCLAAVVFASLVMLFENSFIYFPTKYPDGDWNPPTTPEHDGQIVPTIEDCTIAAADGVKLHGWFCTPQRSDHGRLVPVNAGMVLLWLHGNAGNLSYRCDMIRVLMELPAQVFILDYRGYGKSEGVPSEEGLYLDARGAWDFLTSDRRIPSNRIILFGKSLGGAPAIDLATKVRPAGLIVQSSFTSAADMAAVVMPFIPRFLIRTKLDSISKIKGVSCPKLFIHSRTDEVVPYALGRRLYEAAPVPKRFLDVPRAMHNDTYLVGGPAYLEALRAFIRDCEPGES